MARRLWFPALLLLVAAGLWAYFARSSGASAIELEQQATERHRAHDYAGAIELYRRSLALHSEPRVRANLARALTAAGKCADAAEQYRLLLEAEPQNGVVWHDYGLLLEAGLHDLRAAEEALFNATKYPPKPPEASYDLGRVLMKNGRYEEAGACFEAAIANAPPKAEWLESAQNELVRAHLFAGSRSAPR
jgi:tetratricopeptide (TPR) repeat protein